MLSIGQAPRGFKTKWVMHTNSALRENVDTTMPAYALIHGMTLSLLEERYFYRYDMYTCVEKNYSLVCVNKL